MYESLQSLKEGPSMDQARAQLNKNRDEILENAFRRGLPKEAQFEVSREFKDDMSRGWNHGAMTTADAFAHYYSHFTRDQDHFESQLARLKTPVKVIWGEKDLYIKKEMGIELARGSTPNSTLLPGIGHYPHLQNPSRPSMKFAPHFDECAMAKAHRLIASHDNLVRKRKGFTDEHEQASGRSGPRRRHRGTDRRLHQRHERTAHDLDRRAGPIPSRPSHRPVRQPKRAGLIWSAPMNG